MPALTALLIALAPSLGALESNFGAASTLNPLQALGNSARPLAMGSAFTAVGGDLASLYFNPAGLARLKGSQMSANHNAWLGGVQQDTLLFALGTPSYSFGLTGDLVNYGAIQGFDDNGNPTEPFTPVDYSIGATVAKEFANSLTSGIALRGTQQSIGEAGQLAVSADLGGQYFSPSGVGIGLSYANLGPPVNGRRPTGAFRMGVSYDTNFIPGYGVLAAGSISGMSNGAMQFQAGAEARMAGTILPRLGYQVNFMDQHYGGLSGLCAGLGVKLKSLAIDYAFLPYGVAGQAHRVSLVYNFIDTLAKPEAKAAAAAPAPKAPQAQPAPQPAPPATGKGLELVFESEEGASSEARLRGEAEKAPQDALAWRKLGAWYIGQKRLPEAVAAYEKALAANPADEGLRAWLEKTKAAGNKTAPEGTK